MCKSANDCNVRTAFVRSNSTHVSFEPEAVAQMNRHQFVFLEVQEANARQPPFEYYLLRQPLSQAQRHS